MNLKPKILLPCLLISALLLFGSCGVSAGGRTPAGAASGTVGVDLGCAGGDCSAAPLLSAEAGSSAAEARFPAGGEVSPCPAVFVRTDAISPEAAAEPALTVIDSAAALAAYIETQAGSFDLDSASFIEAAAAYAGEHSAYFEDHLLLLAAWEEPSGSIRHEPGALECGADGAVFTVYRLVPEAGTCDMAGWHALIECSRAAWQGLGEPDAVRLNFETVEVTEGYFRIPHVTAESSPCD